MRKSVKWWSLLLFHNWVAHPILPFGEVLDRIPSVPAKLLASKIFKLHEKSYPE
jgi:hypothetical protein